jgi:hypothetical protein
MFKCSALFVNPFRNLNTDRRFSWRAVTGALSAFLLIAQLTGCSTFSGLFSVDPPALRPGEVTPTSDGVYVDNTYLHVSLEPQDESEGPVPPNDHPVDLSSAQVKAWLAGLKIKPEDSDEPIPLIPENEVGDLSIVLAQALGDARPNQDVVFHSFRRVGSWYGISRRDTTARVFYRNGALNLIFGDLDNFYSEQIDRNLQPLKPGSRSVISDDLSAKLIKSPEFTFVNNRDDWIRIDTSAVAATEPANRRAMPTSASTASGPAPATPTTTAPSTTPMPVTPAGQAYQDPRWAQLEERLLILEGLHQKGLITDKDYEQKKRELLKVLDL